MRLYVVKRQIIVWRVTFQKYLCRGRKKCLSATQGISHQTSATENVEVWHQKRIILQTYWVIINLGNVLADWVSTSFAEVGIIFKPFLFGHRLDLFWSPTLPASRHIFRPLPPAYISVTVCWRGMLSSICCLSLALPLRHSFSILGMIVKNDFYGSNMYFRTHLHICNEGHIKLLQPQPNGRGFEIGIYRLH